MGDKRQATRRKGQVDAGGSERAFVLHAERDDPLHRDVGGLPGEREAPLGGGDRAVELKVPNDSYRINTSL